MENLNLAKLEEMNIIKENVALAASKELLGANDLPAGKSSVSCPLKPSDSAPLKHSTMPP